MRRVTRIKGLSESRRLPRLGKVRLGIKVKSERSGNEYPRETPYFVVPPEVARVHGEQPTRLDIMIPVEDQSIAFPQALEMYGSGRGMKCTGDGEVAYRVNEETGEIEERECPCEFLTGKQPKCSQRAHLSVLLPKVSMGGVYQIDTSSYNSIIDINSSLDYVRALVGRIAMVPLVLVREPRETHHDGKKQTHYTLRIEFAGNVDTINQLRADEKRILSGPQLTIAPPVHEAPDTGPVDHTEVEPPEDGVLDVQQDEPPGQSMEPDVDKQTLMDLIREAQSVSDLRVVAARMPMLPPRERGDIAAAMSSRYEDLVDRDDT